MGLGEGQALKTCVPVIAIATVPAIVSPCLTKFRVKGPSIGMFPPMLAVLSRVYISGRL